MVKRKVSFSNLISTRFGDPSVASYTCWMNSKSFIMPQD
jgi:hypothetical protein